jgi:hypothetical protein
MSVTHACHLVTGNRALNRTVTLGHGTLQTHDSDRCFGHIKLLQAPCGASSSSVSQRERESHRRGGHETWVVSNKKFLDSCPHH